MSLDLATYLSLIYFGRQRTKSVDIAFFQHQFGSIHEEEPLFVAHVEILQQMIQVRRERECRSGHSRDRNPHVEYWTSFRHGGGACSGMTVETRTGRTHKIVRNVLLESVVVGC